VSERSYRVPWDLLFGLGPNIAKRVPTSVDLFTAGVCSRIQPEPLVVGWENLPASPKFTLLANHYQRKGLWILHPAAVLTQAMRRHYGPGDPPVRWIVTANWPRVRLGRFSFRSPGDILLPRVAAALECYPVSFAGTNQAFTARTIRRILRDIPRMQRPLGLFPEGVAGSAGKLAAPLPGVERLLALFARAGLPVVPAGIAEIEGRLSFRFGPTLPVEALLAAPNAADLVMEAVKALLY